MNDNEKKNRDKHGQSVYHTGNIQLEKEDQDEIVEHQLKQIQEGEHESSDEGDGDDYGDEE